MDLTDNEILKLLKIKKTDRVLDVGGSMNQHEEIKVDTLVDIIHPEDAPYGASKLRAKKFVRVDITREKLPFKDKEFDVCLCSHTLEDLPTPFLIIEEMQRVAKRGLIVTPSMGFDMQFTPLDYTDWLTGPRRVPGEAHHKWFFVKNGGELEIIPKNYGILYTPEFGIKKWLGEKEMVYVWKDKIKYKEFVSLNIHKLIDRYQNFLELERKNIQKGRIVVFLDTLPNIVKAVAKKVFKRGVGYVYRSSEYTSEH